MEITDEDSEESLEDNEKEIIIRLQNIFTISFSRDLCLCDSSWESASIWFKDENRRHIDHLNLSVQYLKALKTYPKLQHGLALIIWDTFIRTPFKNLINLINESNGKIPKERQLKKDVFVCEPDLLQFVRSTKELLQCLQESVVDIEYSPIVHLQYEQFLEEYMDMANVR